MRKVLWVSAILTAVAIAAAGWISRPPAVVRDLPPGDTLAYLNLVPLRQSGWLSLSGTLPRSSDYAGFVQQSGFVFERDLDAVAVSMRGSAVQSEDATAVLEGRFSPRLQRYLHDRALHTVALGRYTGFAFPGWARPAQPLTVVPLDNSHLLVTNSRRPAAVLDAMHGQALWQARLRSPLGYVAGDAAAVAAVPGLVRARAALTGASGGGVAAHADLDCATPDDAIRIAAEIEQRARAIVWLAALATSVHGSRIALDLRLSPRDLTPTTGADSGRG